MWDPQQRGQQDMALVATKQPFRDDGLPKRMYAHVVHLLEHIHTRTHSQSVQFSVMSPAQIEQAGVLHVFQRALYQMPERKPQTDGVLDPRLGVSSRSAMCETCGQKLADCVGHFGYIRLVKPVFHIGYFRNMVQILQCICKKCSAVLLPQGDKATWLRRLRRPATDHLARARIFKTINDKCKRQRICFVCKSHNSTVKKASGNLKILHTAHKDDDGVYAATFYEAVKQTPALEALVNKVEEDLNPERVLQLFRCMSDEDCLLLDLPGRPEHLLLQVVPVAPVCIRPSVEMDSMGSNEDDVTMKLMQITEVNNQLREGLKRGVPMSTIMETWDFLQVQCALLINADMPGISLPGAAPGRPSRGFVQRLKGKQGRFRGNLSGKRVDFSGRTVISPDPNVAVDEVCVPQLMACTLTYPERVTQHNIHRLRKCIENGINKWPGANFVCFPDGAKWFLKYGDRQRIARDLKVGDTVERHLDNGDIVLFNRQPSLHRMSIMAHKARVLPWRTLRFNECVCNPYNADFDGDEMNLHVPQTEEAKAEAAALMGVIHNLRTPKNGEILVAATQDFLTASFLLTSKDLLLSRAEVSQLVCEMSDANVHVDLPTPAVLKPAELWTGKQIFSMLMRPNVDCSTCITLETREKHFKRVPAGMDPSMGIEDAYVTIRNSELLTGRLGKGVLGSGNKAGLFQVLATDFGPEAAALCMGRLAKLAARSIAAFGFSIGIDDVTPTPAFNKAKRQLLLDGYDDCDQFRADSATGKLQPQPGSSIAQTLENKISSRLSKVRDEAGELCMRGVQAHNSALVMAQCGSKGSPINIAQMMALVGQQTVGGRRIPNGFQDRTLPHFPRGDVTAEAKGYVANSFFSGLVPTEFLFHTMAGREGLVDTAVKTAETGYMSRRLMKALEDLYVHYDNTVRNASNTIVQLLYGGDGMDPVAMEGSNGEPLQLSRLLTFIQTAVPRCQQGPGGTPLTRLPSSKELSKLVDRLLAEAGLLPTAPPPEPPSWSSKRHSGGNDGIIERAPRISRAFCTSLKEFLDDQVAAMRAAESSGGGLGRGGMTVEELKAFVALCARRYEAKRIDHGSTVGAVGAQSIGEPGTQMTLKTFHFAGVASMNVTLGVPRIKEIINASKNISTPIMEIMLDDSARHNEAEAKRVKARIERTTLRNIADIVVSCGELECCIVIRLRRAAVAKLCLPPMDATDIREAILAHPRSKIKSHHVHLHEFDSDVVEVYSPKTLPIDLQSTLHALQQQLANVVVAGVSTVERVVVASDSKGGKETYQLLAEGLNLRAVMGVQGVDGLQSNTNHVMEVEKCLGIEAARITIADQIKKTMGAHGMGIDDRHTMLLADCMTYKGEVLGITRNGIAKMKDSVLMLASFEKTTDHLFDAALHGRSDQITGVSESIIMGIPMPVGTGLFKLRHTTPQTVRTTPRPPPVLQAVFDGGGQQTKA